MSDRKHDVPGWLLERLAQGELDEATATDVRRRLQAAGLSPDQALADLHASNDEILRRWPPDVMAQTIQRRARAAGGHRFRLSMAVSGALAGTLLLLVVLRDQPGEGPTPLSGGLEPTTLKGDQRPAATLMVYRAEGDAHRRLADGSDAHQGDLLQLAYEARGGARFGAIVSIDGRGTVTRHWPSQGDDAGPLETRREVRLPTSYELDDAPAFERFFFITSNHPFNAGTVERLAHDVAAGGDAARARLPLPGDLQQQSVLLRKTGGTP